MCTHMHTYLQVKIAANDAILGVVLPIQTKYVSNNNKYSPFVCLTLNKSEIISCDDIINSDFISNDFRFTARNFF